MSEWGTVRAVIGRLEGTVRDGCVCTADGVGWRVRTVAALADGAAVTLLVTPVWRDGALELYGFDDAAQRQVFEHLLGVQGVGPAAALSLLATLGADGVAAALAQRDVAALATAPGIGRRTAERICALARPVPDVAGTDTVPAELVAVLVGLGFDRVAARQALEAERGAGGVGDEALLRGALGRLNRGTA